jgi:hypothetical protein
MFSSVIVGRQSEIMVFQLPFVKKTFVDGKSEDRVHHCAMITAVDRQGSRLFEQLLFMSYVTDPSVCCYGRPDRDFRHRTISVARPKLCFLN